MTAVIRTEELTKRYRGLRALDHVNLEVQEGAIYTLVGPYSDSGESISKGGDIHSCCCGACLWKCEKFEFADRLHWRAAGVLRS
jgi:ABC-type uncharacterized transport system YnjBCD ATPase subunit